MLDNGSAAAQNATFASSDPSAEHGMDVAMTPQWGAALRGVLHAEPLRLRRGERMAQALVDEAVADGRVDATAPCHLVADLLIPQAVAHARLIDMWLAGRLRALSLPALTPTDGHPRIIEIDPDRSPESAAATDRVVFVAPSLLREPELLFRHPRIAEYADLAFVPRYFVPTFRIEEPLHVQPDAISFGIRLREAFEWLALIGLVDGALLTVRFAFSSVLMLLRRALGVSSYREAIPYIEDPPCFIAAAFGRTIAADENRQAWFVREVYALLLAARGPSRRDDDPRGADVVPATSRWDYGTAASILTSMNAAINPCAPLVAARFESVRNEFAAHHLDWLDDIGSERASRAATLSTDSARSAL